MPSKIINGITVVFDHSEGDTAEVIRDAASRALAVIKDSWGLVTPQDCRIYIMTSWLGFFFQSAPWGWRILLAITFPLWCFRAQRTWPYSGAWTQRYGRKIAIGIKPPRLLEKSDKSIGKLLFVEEKDTKTKVQHLTCHELTHACSANLRLPAWLNEGLAAVTVDRYLEKRTIRMDTFELLRSFKPYGSPATYAILSRSDPQAIAYQSALGYWLVQYLEDVRPGYLNHLLTLPPNPRMIDTTIAAELGIEPVGFWSKIPDMIVAHYMSI